MSESKFWSFFAKNMTYKFHLKRIENKLAKGLPDCIWVHKSTGHMGYLEFKYAEMPKNVAASIPIMKEQVLEAYEWSRYTKRIGIFCKFENGPYMYFPARPTLDWVSSIQKKLTTENLEKLPHYSWSLTVAWWELEQAMLGDSMSKRVTPI
jgi:hypothetical protein